MPKTSARLSPIPSGAFCRDWGGVVSPRQPKIRDILSGGQNVSLMGGDILLHFGAEAHLNASRFTYHVDRRFALPIHLSATLNI